MLVTFILDIIKYYAHYKISILKIQLHIYILFNLTSESFKALMGKSIELLQIKSLKIQGADFLHSMKRKRFKRD